MAVFNIDKFYKKTLSPILLKPAYSLSSLLQRSLPNKRVLLPSRLPVVLTNEEGMSWNPLLKDHQSSANYAFMGSVQIDQSGDHSDWRTNISCIDVSCKFVLMKNYNRDKSAFTLPRKT